MLYFYMPGCPPCTDATAVLQRVAAEYKTADVRFVSIAHRGSNRDIASEGLTHAAGADGNLELVLDDYDDQTLAKRWQLRAYPTVVVVDNSGTVRGVVIGTEDDFGTSVRQAIESAVSGNAANPRASR